MTKALIIKYSIAAAGVIGAFILLLTVINRISGNNDQNSYLVKELIRAKDEQLQQLRTDRDEWKKQIRFYENEIADLRRYDSALLAKQKQVIIKYESISHNVRNLNREELRSAAIDFE